MAELIELLKNSSTAAPAAVFFAWGIKEFFSFLLRWKKAESSEAKEYRPDDEWRKYCIEKFDSIVKSLGELTVSHRVLESQQQTIRLQVSRIENDIHKGGRNGRN